MAEIEKIDNYYENLVDGFPTQFRDKPNIDAYLETWAEQLQDLENCLWELKQETQYYNAVGVQLDIYGELFGIKRPPGMNDSDYKVLISGEIIARASDSTGDSIRKITEAVTQLKDTEIIEINNTLYWRSIGYPKLTGDVMIYGYYTVRDRLLPSFAGDELKKACPVTTEKAILGQHINFSDTVNSLYIPCEVILVPEEMGVETPLGNTPLDELVTDPAGTDNIAVTSNNIAAYGPNYELGILPEDASGGGALAINAGEGFEEFQIETETGGVETLLVQTAGIQADHGVMLEISVSN